MLRITKGNFGYIDSHKKIQALKTFVFFLIPIAIFAAGYITTGGKENYFTIIAILGCLPACKELVNVIMFARYHSIPVNLYDNIHLHADGMGELYELTLTTYEHTYPIESMIIYGNEIVGYTSDKESNLSALTEHIEKTLRNNGIGGVHIHFFTKLEQYLSRIDTLSVKEKENPPFSGDDRYPGMNREEVIMYILLSLSA